MADEIKKVLFSVEVNTGQSKANVDALTKSQTENAEASNKQTTAINKTNEAIKAEENSIADLRKRNKELTQERNNLSTATDLGRTRIQQINDELTKNNAVIKDNVDAYTKQKMGIGDYQGAIERALPGVGGMTSGFMGMTKASLAFIATPIGAIIAAIGLALSSLMAYFKGSEEGQNRLNMIMEVGSAIMERVMDVVEDVGEAIFNAFTNPKQALIDLYEFLKQNLINRFTAFKVILEGIMELDFKKMGNGIIQATTGVENAIDKVSNLAQEIVATVKTAVDEGQKLAKLNAEIDARDRMLIVERARVSLEVSKLRQKAISEEGDLKKKTIEEAIALETKLSNLEVIQAQARLDEAKQRAKTEGETKEALKEIANAEAALFNAREQRYAATLRFEKELEKLRDEEKAKRDKEREEEEKRLADDKAKKDAEQLERDRKDKEDKAKKDKEEADRLKKQADYEIKIDKYKNDALQGGADLLLGNKKQARILLNTVFKKDAIVEATTNTHAAAIAAYKSLASIPIVGPALGAVAAAAVTAYGFAQVAGIVGLAFPGFAKGGISGTRVKSNMGIPINRSNGDNLLATIKTNEVILNEEQQARLGGARTFAKIGVPGFASGGSTYIDGYETKVAANDVITASFVSDITSALLNQPNKILVLEEFEAKQQSVNAIKESVKVI